MQLLDAYRSSQKPTKLAESAVQAYFEWQNSHHQADFRLSADDDVDLRTYLSYLRIQGLSPADLDAHGTALKGLYGWAFSEGHISTNPFDEYIFTYPLLNGTEAAPQSAHMAQDPVQFELESLRALDQITEELIRVVDIHSALEGTLEKLLNVMQLETGWISMRTDSRLSDFEMDSPPEHGYVLAAARSLPAGLEYDERRYLRQPPACRCQQLLQEGRLNRAVNIVECSRLRDARLADGDTRQLQYHASVPLTIKSKPVGLINVATHAWQFLTRSDLRFLSSVGVRLSAALERAQYYEIAESQRLQLEKELKVAREVQQGLMRWEMPDIPGYQLACTWQPARQVSGDFYNIFPLENGRWVLLIGDVADKGTAAALYMAMVQSLILTEALRKTSPAEILLEVNRLILRQTSSVVYVSVFLAVIDPRSGNLHYANAGHNPPRLRREDGTVQALNNTGSVVGVFEDFQLSDQTITLQHGEALVLHTDGLTEAWRMQPEFEDYGEDRLTEALRSAPPHAEGNPEEPARGFG